MNFERNLRVIASTVHLSLNEGILLATALAEASKPTRVLYDLNTHDGRVAWVRQDTEAMDFLKSDRKIQAIKRVRDVIQCGLKEAKDAVDEVVPRRLY